MNYAPPLFHVALEEVERSHEISHDKRTLGQQEAIRRCGVRGPCRAKSHQFGDLAFLRGSRSSCFCAFVRLLAEGDSLQRVLIPEGSLSHLPPAMRSSHEQREGFTPKPPKGEGLDRPFRFVFRLHVRRSSTGRRGTSIGRAAGR